MFERITKPLGHSLLSRLRSLMRIRSPKDTSVVDIYKIYLGSESSAQFQNSMEELRKTAALNVSLQVGGAFE